MTILNVFVVFVRYYDDFTVECFEIDDQEPFISLRKKVAEKFNYNFNDLLIIGGVEYNGSYNSKKISEISGIYDQCTLLAKYEVGGGAITL